MLQKMIKELLAKIEEMKEWHTHDSIPTYYSEAESGCVTCVRNVAIRDVIERLEGEINE